MVLLQQTQEVNGKVQIFFEKFITDLAAGYLSGEITYNAEIIDEAVSTTGKRQANVFGWYSMTTSRHINEFLQQYGFDKMSKKQMEGGAI